MNQLPPGIPGPQSEEDVKASSQVNPAASVAFAVFSWLGARCVRCVRCVGLGGTIAARWRATRERGAGVTLVAVIMAPALLLCVGLVVDGGGKVQAARDAQGSAGEAARAAENAAASGTLTGDDAGPAAYQAARAYLNAAGVSGSVHVAGNQVVVDTTAVYQPVFLSMIGVPPMTAHGEATAKIASVGP